MRHRLGLVARTQISVCKLPVAVKELNDLYRPNVDVCVIIIQRCIAVLVFCRMREALKEFLKVPFQAREVVLDGIQPQSLKTDIALTEMSYQSVFLTVLVCDLLFTQNFDCHLFFF